MHLQASEFTQFSVSLPSASPSELRVRRARFRRFSKHSLEVRVKQRDMSQSHRCAGLRTRSSSSARSDPRAPRYKTHLRDALGLAGSAVRRARRPRGTCGLSINVRISLNDQSVPGTSPVVPVSLQPDLEPPRLRVSLSARLSPGTRAPLGRAVTCAPVGSATARPDPRPPALARPTRPGHLRDTGAGPPRRSCDASQRYTVKVASRSRTAAGASGPGAHLDPPSGS